MSGLTKELSVLNSIFLVGWREAAPPFAHSKSRSRSKWATFLCEFIESCTRYKQNKNKKNRPEKKIWANIKRREQNKRKLRETKRREEKKKKKRRRNRLENIYDLWRLSGVSILKGKKKKTVVICLCDREYSFIIQDEEGTKQKMKKKEAQSLLSFYLFFFVFFFFFFLSSLWWSC